MARAARFIGIDLTTTPARPTACVALDENLRLRWHGWMCEDDEILAAVQHQQPQAVAVDAPLSLPLGLCCLEQSCPCRPLSLKNGRMCERELSRRGIGCFYTTKRSLIRSMAYRGISLRRRMADAGLRVIEAYPYAAKVQLFGRGLPRKTTVRGMVSLRACIGHVMPRLTSHLAGFNHDMCDAVIAAYTAFLYGAGAAEAVGDGAEGVIWIPASGARSAPSASWR